MIHAGALTEAYTFTLNATTDMCENGEIFTKKIVHSQFT